MNQSKRQLKLEFPAGMSAVYSNGALVSQTNNEIVFDFIQVLPNDARARVLDQARLPVHELGRMGHDASEHLPEGLVTQAHPEHRGAGVGTVAELDHPNSIIRSGFLPTTPAK